MKHTRHFRKRATAILTMLALLVSVVAAMGVLPLSADAASVPYTPKRVMSITSTGSEAEGKMLITASGSYLGEGKAVTIKGYYKVENYTVVNPDASPCVQIGPEATSGAISVTANTDGWVAFEQSYTTGDSKWLKYGFWYTTGTLSIADLTMTDGDGNVIYDMATDSKLVAGDIAPGSFPQQQGMWYLGYYNSADNVSVHIDPVYVAPYTPKRVMSITSTGSEAEGKMLITASGSYLGEGKAVTVKGYYKVENYTVVNPDASPCVQIGPEATSGAISVTANTDGWVAFEQSYTTGDSKWLKYGFWYTTGTLSIADLTMTDGDGNVIYDMATDSKLVAGDIAPGNFPQQQGMWYLGYYNSADNVSVHIDPVYEDSEEPVEPVEPVKPDPGLVPVPEIPDLLDPDASGYQPNRAFAIVSTTDDHPSVSFAQFAREGYLEEGKYYIFAKIRITDFAAHADAAVSSCSILMGDTVLATWTGNTDGWVDLTDADGKLISFGAFAKRTDILKLSFHTQGAAANFAVADLMIANEKGDILYSLANDGSLNAVGDMRYTDKSHWDAWDATPETPTSAFPIRTRGAEDYVPNVSVTLQVDDLTDCEPFQDEAFIAWLSSNGLFKAGEKYTISGMIRVNVRAGIKNNTMPKMALTGMDNDLIFHSTGGWVSLLNADGSPVTFTATEEANAVYVKFNFYRAHGTMSLADIVIRDSKGEVVWDMSRDAGLISFKDKVTEGFVQKGELIKWFFYPSAQGAGWVDVNENPVEHTAADYQIPHFDEIAPVPSQPVNPEPTDPEPTNPEPTNPEPTNPEPTNPEPTNPEPTNPEPTDPDPTGDSIAVAAVLLAASAALMGAAVTNRRKNRA